MTELLDIATRVAGWANRDEQVEAFVVHESETEVRAYEGEIESLTRAESRGIGVRVIVEGKQGYAYAGTLDEDALAETLREARDNAAFAEADEFNGLATPDGVDPAALELWSDGLDDFSIDDKVGLAIELERLTRGADPRISGIESAEYIDTAYERAVATSTGIATQPVSLPSSMALRGVVLFGQAGTIDAGSGVVSLSRGVRIEVGD